MRSYARNISTLAAIPSLLQDTQANFADVSDPTLYSYLNIRKRLYVIEDVPACLEIAVFFPNATLYRPFVID